MLKVLGVTLGLTAALLASGLVAAQDRTDGPPVDMPGVITKGSGDTASAGSRLRAKATSPTPPARSNRVRPTS